jgi:hypothetical protein
VKPKLLMAAIALLAPTPAFADYAVCLAFDPFTDPNTVLLATPFTSPPGSAGRSDSLKAQEAEWWAWVKSHRNAEIPAYDAQCRNFTTEAARTKDRNYFLNGESVYGRSVKEVDWRPGQ